MIAAFAVGVVSWWALEYLLHRFVGHMPRGRSLFSREHRRHHAEGHYFAPNAKKALSVTPGVLGVGALLGALTTWAHGAGYAAGLAAMYLAYEVLHRRLHTHPPRTAYGRWARRHHFHHHFVNPRANHGVTTPLGDLLFGTRDDRTRIPVPERLAMPWLVDESKKCVRPEYAGDYRLVPLGGSRRDA